MVVILCAFDEKIGPTKLYSIPSRIDDDTLSKVLLLMNNNPKDDEILINDFKSIGMKSFTMHVMVPSKWSRGGKNMTQITVLTRIEDAPSKKVEREILEFKSKIMKHPDTYKGLYLMNTKRSDESQLKPHPIPIEIETEQKFLMDACMELFQKVTMGVPASFGCVSTVESVSEGKFTSTEWFATEIENISISKGTKKFFIIHRVDSEGSMTVKIIPIKHDAMNVKVKMKQLEANQIMQISAAIKLPLLSTSGICRESKKDCFYDGYFEYDGDFHEISNEISIRVKNLDFVEDVLISKVSMK